MSKKTKLRILLWYIVDSFVMPARGQVKHRIYTSFVQKAYWKARLALGRYATNSGNIQAASCIFSVDPKSVAYWKQKVNDPSFHSLPHGGLQQMAFLPLQYEEINNILWDLCQRKPTLHLGEYEFLIK